MMDTKLDEATELLSRSYKVMRANGGKRGTPLYNSFMELLRYVEDDVLERGGECPE